MPLATRTILNHGFFYQMIRVQELVDSTLWDESRWGLGKSYGLGYPLSDFESHTMLILGFDHDNEYIESERRPGYE